MAPTPLTIRNRTPWILRVFALLWMGMLVLATIAAVNEAGMAGRAMLPYVLAFFWIAGLALTVFTFRLEDSVVVVETRGRLRVTRGPFYRPVRHELAHLDMRFKTERDSEGDLHHRLLLAVPPAPLVIAEGGDREKLKAIKIRIEAAFARPT